VEKAFLDAEAFSIVYGEEFMVGGDLKFPQSVELKMNRDAQICHDGTYRTRFGPAVDHNGVIYANSPHNLSLGLRRLTAARFPEEPGKHQEYMRRQERFIEKNDAFIRFLRDLYAPIVGQFKGFYQELRDHVSDPHPKKELREHAYAELQESGALHEKYFGTRSVTYKNKKNEIAKPGKYIRLIGDLKVPASLQGFVLTKLLKDAMSEEFVYGDCTFYFCAKPRTSILQSVFEKLISPPTRSYFVFFSDDSCYSRRNPDGTVN
jgi:hypothetical protein